MRDGLAAITFDFGNTLVPFPAAPMAVVVRLTATRAVQVVGCSAEEFIEAWSQERQRQLAEEVPQGREADMDVRVVRVLARLRGMAAPAPGSSWDDAGAATRSEPDEVQAILETYAGAFVAATPVPPGIEPMLERLSAAYRLGLISNWPLAIAVDRFLETAGWRRYLRSVVISQRVGVIKPRPGIFEIAATELGVASGPSILHVGDDPGADVVGAQQVGWRAAWVRLKPEDSTLPVAPPAPDVRPDLTVDSVLDLESALAALATSSGK